LIKKNSFGKIQKDFKQKTTSFDFVFVEKIMAFKGGEKILKKKILIDFWKKTLLILTKCKEEFSKSANSKLCSKNFLAIKFFWTFQN